jgi:hypothetical protein
MQGRGSGIRLAAAYYLFAGLIGAALGAWIVFSLVGAILGGYCDTTAPGELFCGEYLPDFLALIVASVVGVTLLPTARRLRRDPPRLGPLVGVGVVVGIAVAVLPIVLILRVADLFGSFNIFGSEVPTVRLVLPFIGPLLWALASAVAVWRQAAGKQERRELVMAIGAGSLIAVLVPLLIGPVGGMAVASQPAITESSGTMTLRLEGPIDLFDSGEASCTFDDSGEQLSVSRDPDPDLDDPDERFSLTTVTVTAGDLFASGREPRDDGLELSIMIGNPYADDEDARGADLVSTPESVLESRWDPASGSLRFTRLAAIPYGGGPPEDTTEWQGIIEWTCPNL